MRFGDWQADRIQAGTLRLDGGAMFGIVPKALWQRVAPPDEQNRIELALNCLLLRNGRNTILVETGMGEKWREKDREIYALGPDGKLESGLREQGVTPESIDTVILTHLHFDHAGGATRREPGGAVVPAFPNATYLVQRSEWDFAHQNNERTRASYIPENYEPLDRSGRLRLIEGEQEPFPGIRLVPLPGHTPGLQGVRIDGGGGTALYPSDLIPTHAHLPYPYIMGYDVFPLTTLSTRKAVFPVAAAGRWTLLLGHEPGEWAGMLEETEPGRLRWRSLTP